MARAIVASSWLAMPIIRHKVAMLPGVEQVAPQGTDRHAQDDVQPQVHVPPIGTCLGQELMDRFLEDEPRHAGAGFQQREDEEGLEHDHEVIPVAHQGLHAGQTGEDLGHAHGQRHRPAGLAGEVLFARTRPARHRTPSGFMSSPRRALNAGHDGRVTLAVDVDLEVVARFQGTGGNQGRDGHEAFQEHRPIADRAGCPFRGRSFWASCPN